MSSQPGATVGSEPVTGSIAVVGVATDRSVTATRAVRWAADLAARSEADLCLIQVVLPEEGVDPDSSASSTRIDFLTRELRAHAAEIGWPNARLAVVIDDDPARGIIDAAEEQGVDTLVVGNAGMTGRKEFLLGNVPNRISHNARCTVIIVNTAQLTDDARPIPVAPGASERVQRVEKEPPLIGRATEIGTVMTRHGLKTLFGKLDDPADEQRRQATELRAALEELGPTFAKLGQILSTRADLLPPVFIEELATLQDSVPPLDEAAVVKVMEEELGVPWEDVFATIDPAPLAAGTIGQVHRATLTDGEQVVVKVQRPTARGDIMRDLGLLELFAEKSASRPALRQMVDLPAVVEHMSSSLQRELDFRQEAAHLNRMREILEPYDRLDCPKVYGDFTTERLLVLEFIPGVPLRDAPTDAPERAEAARQLLESFYKQILTEGFFHADPHPGNLLWADGVIYFLDLGMVGELDPEMRDQLMLLVMAFWQQDVPFLTDIALSLAHGESHPDVDVDAFRHDLGEMMARFQNKSLEELQLGPILQEMTEIAIRHELPLPASLTLTGKALAQMQLATAALDPTIDPFDVAGSYMVRRMTGQFREKADLKKMFYGAQKFRVRIMRLVEAFERLAGSRPGPKLQVNFAAERLEDTVRRAGRRLSLAIVSAALLFGSAMTTTATRVALWVPWVLGIAGVIMLGALTIDLLSRDG